MQTAPTVGVPPVVSATTTPAERPIHADYRAAVWATVRDPMLLVTLVGLVAFALAGSAVYANLEYEQSFTRELRDAPLGLWGFIWIFSAAFTPWRMYQASRLVPQMVGRGFALRDPSLGGGRPLTWRPLVAVGVSMFATALLGGWLVNVTWGRDEAHRWFEDHPAALLASMCLISGFAYLVSRVLIGTVVEMAISRLQLVPIPYHVDNCNGFWPFGYFGLRNAIGVWIIFLTLPQLLLLGVMDEISVTGIDLVRFLIVYGIGFAVIVGADLMMSIWKVHGIMARHKRKALDATTSRLAELMATIDRTAERHDTDYLELLALDVRYQTEAREYMVWPFGYLKFLAAAGVGAAAGPVFGFIWQKISGS